MDEQRTTPLPEPLPTGGEGDIPDTGVPYLHFEDGASAFPAQPPPLPWWRRVGAMVSGAPRATATWIARYFEEQDPTFWVAVTPALVVATLIFVRSPGSNYIFDEQEALLANPYVNDRTLGFVGSLRQAFYCDFWGLPPTRSIGSYRPLPNLVWRALWQLSDLPWLHHWVNVVIHAANGALLAAFAFVLTRRRVLAWLVGATFLTSAVLTEAVTGVVGLADVLCGLGMLAALHALRAPWLAMPFLVALATLFGFLSKESAIVAVPLVPWVAFVAAPALHPKRPLRWLRPLLALLGVAVAMIAYTEIRRRTFYAGLEPPTPTELAEHAGPVSRLFHQFLDWFRQPRLPADPINNPLILADFPLRVAGALRVYWRGLTQVAFPVLLAGDYSFPQEPAPTRVVFPESVLGAAFLVLPPILGLGCAGALLAWRDARAWRGWLVWSDAVGRVIRLAELISRFTDARASRDPRVPKTAEERAAVVGRYEAALQDPEFPPAPSPRDWAWITGLCLLAIGLVWVPVAYFPHSNIPVELPTVRAERFWYLPVLGSSMVLPLAFLWAIERLTWRRLGVIAVCCFLGFQALRARIHAFSYTDDLVFWKVTRWASSRSAKAHLNYSVMLGARGYLEQRLEVNRRAIELAPEWPMAHVYQGDTLCRLDRADEAWPHYVRGWELNPNDSNLIALSLQCLWDHNAIERHRAALIALVEADKHQGSWLAYLVSEVVYNGAENNGVPQKYRPRGYDQGPKE